jgi:tRNA(fMet)-specific endonuclease VapC
MLQYLLDTDHLTLFQHGHAPLGRRLILHPSGSVGISVVTIEEAFRGRLAALARAGSGPVRIRDYGLLTGTLLDIARFPGVPYDQAVEDEFQRIRHIRIGTRDLKIAATALANRLIVVTSDRRDFGRVPGLVIEDWSV